MVSSSATVGGRRSREFCSLYAFVRRVVVVDTVVVLRLMDFGLTVVVGVVVVVVFCRSAIHCCSSARR